MATIAESANSAPRTAWNPFEWLVQQAWVRNNPALRSFVVAAWLGWQIESNWADPFLFAIYSIARPISSVLILVVMYSIITSGATEQPIFAYIYLGNALYILVAQVITGTSWAVIDDREHYRTVRQIHTSPVDTFYYLMGRGVARLIIGALSVTIVVIFGMIFFDLPIRLSTVNLPLFLLSTTLGIIALAGMGVIIGGLTLMMARNFWFIGEMVGAGLFLFTGAIFPLETLPSWLRPVGYAFPVTYWLEVARRSLLGDAAQGFPTLAAYSNLQLLGILAAFAVVLSIASYYLYGWMLHMAKERGQLDMETAY